MFNRIKMELLNFGMKFMSVDQKLVRMFLETSPSNIKNIVILPAVKLVMKKILRKLENKQSRGRVFNGTLNGVEVSVIRSMVGSPNMAIILECLNRCKVKMILRVDFCGGISNKTNDIDIGDILVPSIAYCGEGTTFPYLMKHPSLKNQLESIKNPIDKVHQIKSGNQVIFASKPSSEINQKLLEINHSLSSISLKLARFWTTDALFCETQEFIEALKSINVQGIDMESSILFLLGALYQIKTASILSISDLPGTKYDLFHSNEMHPKTEVGINDAINLLIKSLPSLKELVK